ncbi:hypothetical protein [Candidatus Protochlamydia phocaeensis]|uniref:hypothetical protein n=1 Tax=Candidatus Protochlamydia phocaeensis TaxID=1414722 RepID=UPI000837F5C9|nr:hypothetical protein [Candidatus Protochlamydia phocaeensis]
MRLKDQIRIALSALFIAMALPLHTLLADDEDLITTVGRQRIDKIIEPYLIPKDSLLAEYLKALFNNPSMLNSVEHLKKAGFTVKNGNHKNGRHRLMVASHPLLPYLMFKKFPNGQPQKQQLDNFLKRIHGAEILRRAIAKHNCKHLVVPQKWLYKLPQAFADSNGPSYLLVVENMDIYDDWKDPNGVARSLYYNMDIETLTEFCIVLHEVGGCDAYPRNQPFTRSGKIAFVDTEHVGHMKGHFLKHIVPELNPDLQAYAIALWNKLEQEKHGRYELSLLAH